VTGAHGIQKETEEDKRKKNGEGTENHAGPVWSE